MLLLSRRKQEAVVIGAPDAPPGAVTVTVLEINRRQVKLGFEVTHPVSIQRQELWLRIQQNEFDATQGSHASSE